MMNAEDKQNILDFMDFYVVLGIVHQKTLCKYLGISARTIQRWRKNGTADDRSIAGWMILDSESDVHAGYPKCFHSLKESCEWFSNFIHWYNYEHKHSALQYVTPMEKRKGKYIGIFENKNSKKYKRYEVRKVEVLNPDERKSA